MTEFDIDPAPGNRQDLVPVANAQSISKMDDAVARMAQLADGYTCDSAADYEAGGRAVKQVRELTTLYQDIFKPLKDFWHKRHADTCADEKARVAQLEGAKTRIGAHMLAWKAAQDAAAIRIVKEMEAIARFRATANQTAIAPTILAPSVPKLSGVKTVNRLAVEVVDLSAFLMCVGATLLLEHANPPADVKVWLQDHSAMAVRQICWDKDRCEKLGDAFVPYLKESAKFYGRQFIVPGVTAGKKEGLG